MTQFALVGIGSTGKVALVDLLNTLSIQDKILVIDSDPVKLEYIHQHVKDQRLTLEHIDIFKHTKRAQKLLEHTDIMLNCAPYEYNYQLMELALAHQAHYLDMGGLFHMTREQLGLHQAFKKAKLTAIIGMGTSPGTTNIMANYAGQHLDRVHEIHIRVASNELAFIQNEFQVFHAIKTTCQEFILPAAHFTKGNLIFVEPASNPEMIRFPKPIHTRETLCVIHSELGTLPQSYQSKGIQEISFKFALPNQIVNGMKFLKSAGLLNPENIILNGTMMNPLHTTTQIMMQQAVAHPISTDGRYEIRRVVVKGLKNLEQQTWVMDCHIPHATKWKVACSLKVDSGSSIAIVAQMLAAGKITMHGVLPPETAVPPKEYFEQLFKRNIFLKIKKMRGWDYKISH